MRYLRTMLAAVVCAAVFLSACAHDRPSQAQTPAPVAEPSTTMPAVQPPVAPHRRAVVQRAATRARGAAVRRTAARHAAASTAPVSRAGSYARIVSHATSKAAPARPARRRHVVAVSALAPVAEATPVVVEASGGSGPVIGQAATTGGSRAPLTVTLNTVNKGVYIVIVRGTDVLVTREDLAAIGIANLIPPSATGDLVSLSSLSDALKFALDAQTLTLALTVDPHYLGASSFAVNGMRHVDVSRTSSQFLNYGVLATTNTTATFSTQFGSTLGPGTFTITFDPVAGQYRATNLGWTDDNADTMSQLTVGDAYVNLSDVSGAGVIRGVTTERNFGLNPYYSHLVGHQLSGYATTPSTADVYVNGVLVDELQIPAGSFNISNIPYVVGNNNAQVIVRDAFGNVQTLSQSYYEGLAVLPRGMTDYTYTAGDPQDGLGDSVGPLTGAAQYSIGLAHSVTVGAIVEGAHTFLNGGPTLAVATGIGEFNLLGFASSAGGASGTAGEFLYTYTSGRVSFDAQYQEQSASYADSFLTAVDDRYLNEINAGIGFPIAGPIFLDLTYDHSNDRDLGALSGVGAQTSVRLSQHIVLALNFQHQFGSFGVRNDLYGTFLIPTGRYASVNVTGDAASAGGTETLTASDQARPDNPLGYQLSDSHGPNGYQQFYNVQYDAPFGAYYAQTTNLGAATPTWTTQVNASGSIVLADNHVFFARPITGGYVVVDANGVGSLPIYSNGIYIGKTNGQGLLLVPDVTSFVPNTLHLDSTNLPLDVGVNAEDRSVIPGYYSAAIARFGIARMQSFVGTIAVVVAGKSVAPSYGRIFVDVGNGPQEMSEIGESGEFYFTNVPAGDHAATIRYSGGTCTFTLNVPTTTDPYVRLGQLTCTNFTPTAPAGNGQGGHR